MERKAEIKRIENGYIVTMFEDDKTISKYFAEEVWAIYEMFLHIGGDQMSSCIEIYDSIAPIEYRNTVKFIKDNTNE